MPRDASRSRSPSRVGAAPPVRWALLPLCTHPKQDLATPAKVSKTAAARLRKRAQREREQAKQNRETAADELLVRFPWNDGTRAAVADRPIAPSRLGGREGDISCPVCDASNARACSCGAKFADATNTRALTFFVTLSDGRRHLFSKKILQKTSGVWCQPWLRYSPARTSRNQVLTHGKHSCGSSRLHHSQVAQTLWTV